MLCHVRLVLTVPLESEQKGADKLGYEAEAFAIYDTMKYIKPPVHTLCVGTAFGESAMLLASGTPVRAPAISSACYSFSIGTLVLQGLTVANAERVKSFC